MTAVTGNPFRNRTQGPRQRGGTDVRPRRGCSSLATASWKTAITGDVPSDASIGKLSIPVTVTEVLAVRA